jgi:hypothetical protein
MGPGAAESTDPKEPKLPTPVELPPPEQQKDPEPPAAAPPDPGPIGG